MVVIVFKGICKNSNAYSAWWIDKDNYPRALETGGNSGPYSKGVCCTDC